MRFARPRITMRRMMAGVAFAALGLSYVGSYYQLSRRGAREAADCGIDGFLYVPVAEAAARGSTPPRHDALARFYWPLNRLDRALFRGLPPAGGILWRLGG